MARDFRAAFLLLGLVWVQGACVGDSTTSDGGTDATADTTMPDVSSQDSPMGDGGDAGCGNTQTDPSNCGSCGHVCSGTGATCVKGVCGNTVIQIAGGPSSGDTCALLANGTVWCWGDNPHGELGLGDKNPRNKATQITTDYNNAAFDHVVEIAEGAEHTCARKDDGSIWCWGFSQFGQTGVGVGSTVADTLKPQPVGALTGFKAIRAAGFTTCGIDGSGFVLCWGSNDHLALGHAANTNSDTVVNGGGCNGTVQTYPSYANQTPVTVAGVSGVTQLTMSDQFSCVVDSTGALKCWGADDYNQLGDIPTAAYPNNPCGVGVTTISVATNPSGIGVSFAEACSLYSAGDAKCWGKNQEGELGTGNGAPSGPVSFGGGGYTLSKVAGGEYHLCVIKSDGHVFCSGRNDNRQLGNPAIDGGTQTPTPVLIGTSSTQLASAVGLSAGYFQSCAIRSSDNTVWCWGDNTVGTGGRLGNGTNTAQTGAVQVVGLP